MTYRCLLPLKIDNLLAAGRIVSATHVSSGSVRVMAQCMANGHAAGVAAALSIANDSTPRNLNVNLLQETLRSQAEIL
ncbi:hypothetical protein B4O97_13930 [Marispirochaeta aestuarii]|uniref:FAD-dependent oxidoreductase n=1 Tax=Marispirochaeta aestuarii TaxID=1963862 RepID=A0A1Y1RVD9_9SPIO|nr:hypothetical protein B4O97_13930 [Marispirochaeta aestuarii]